MEDTLIGLLETFGFPVVRQGSLAPETAYPATFFTFWNTDEDGQSFYDNDNIRLTAHYFNVNVYSNNADTAYLVQRQARDLLKSNGWIITSRGYDAPSDEVSHIGRGFTAIYLENFEGGN